MSNLHSFTSDKTLITHDGTVVWSEPVTGRHSLDFSTVSDSTLTDSMNETYATAVEDNETQYLSILETTNDITLEDLHNLTLENPKIQMQEILEYNSENVVENVDANTIDVGNQQVVVFSVDGSDELFGIQFAQDEEGNLQKYQFKFRTTENGQLEAIPDSIELLANDEAENQNLANVNEVLVQEIESHETEVTETPVFFTEDGRDPGIQETHVYIQQGEETVEEYEELRQDDQNVNIYIKGEQGSEPHTDEDCDFDENQEDYDGQQELHYEETEEVPEEQHFEEETVDIKAGILEENLAVQNSSANIKQELLQEDSQEPAAYSEESQDYHPYENHQEIAQGQYEENTMSDANDEEVNIQHDVQGEDYTTIEIEGVHESVLQYQQYISEDDQHIYEDAVTTEGQDMQEGPQHYEQLFIQETQVPVEEMSTEVEAREEDDEHSIDEQFVTETGTENDSDNDDYQIVEGLHITAEGDINEEALPSITGEPETVLQEVVEKPASVVERANILKQTSLLRPMREIRPKGNNNNKTIVYYVVPHVEKENVNSMPVNNTSAAYRQNRSIPRTVLKNSYADYGQDPVRGLVDERMNKRFARSKEAVQARLFNNFISKTTIPHAPVRQTRLPRKQQIKPVDARRNEEIIVQEVMVSSKGFIENVEERLRNKDKLEVTGYVVLTDSDDDYDPKQGNKKKKKHKKHQKADGTAVSDDSDVSVIEIPSDGEEAARGCAMDKDKESPRRGRGRPRKSVDTSDGGKRRRGRPPKGAAPDTEEESPTKKSRTESDDDTPTMKKEEAKCPHCPKSFPSQNSLTTHIQHHNLENSLRNKAGAVRQSVIPEYRHRCDDCQESFKNSILLKRHQCKKKAPPKPVTRLECTMCKKTFPTVHTLNIHKRSHVKENLVNATTVTKVSPKKAQPRASTSSRPKSPRRTTAESRGTFKCKECLRVCYSQESLARHEKTHRKYRCPTCAATFPSRLLLDEHIRVKCVKTASPSNKRLSFKIRKSYVHSPRRKSVKPTQKANPPNTNNTTENAKMTLGVKLECSACGETFPTFQDKFKHQVKAHGLQTPDKSILAEQKKLLHKPKTTHGGIPARDAMRSVFAGIKANVTLVSPGKDSN